jgi:hypothetical protein
MLSDDTLLASNPAAQCTITHRADARRVPRAEVLAGLRGAARRAAGNDVSTRSEEGDRRPTAAIGTGAQGSNS